MMVRSDQDEVLFASPMPLDGTADYRALCPEIARAAAGMRYAGHEVHVHSVHWAESLPWSRVTPHQHSYYEALLIVDGEAVETVGLAQPLTPGLLQLHAPGQIHGWESSDSHLIRFGIWFTLDHPLPLLPEVRWPLLPGYRGEMGRIFQEARASGTGSSDRLHARLLLLLSHFFSLLAWPPDSSRQTAHPTWSLADWVVRFLRDNLDQPLTLSDVATNVNVSIPTLTRRFRSETGGSVMDHFEALRMEEAGRLLREGGMTVKEVAARTGFTESSYFCRRFRARFNTSPQRYRGR